MSRQLVGLVRSTMVVLPTQPHLSQAVAQPGDIPDDGRGHVIPGGEQLAVAAEMEAADLACAASEPHDPIELRAVPQDDGA